MKELIKAAVLAWIDKKLDKIKEVTPELRVVIHEAISDYLDGLLK